MIKQQIQMINNQLPTSKIEIRKFIIKWNNNYPIDFIWRKKYGVAFGSQEHRHMSFLDMLIDLEEDEMMKEIVSIERQKKKSETELSDKEFDDIDINQFNTKQNG